MPILFFLLLFISPIFGADPVIEVSLNPQVIGTQEVAQFSISIINDRAASPPVPSTESPDLEIQYAGLQNQREISIVNGRMENRTIFTYLYQIRPERSGTLTIPTFIVTLESGKQIYSPSSRIEVLNQANINNTNPNQGFGGLGGFFSQNVVPTAFLQWKIISAPEIIQNTGFIAYLYFYTDSINLLQNLSLLQEIQGIRFDGGIIHEINLPNNNDIIQNQFDLSLYYGKIIKAYVIYPLDDGELNLYPPAYYYSRGIFQGQVGGEDLEFNSRAVTPQLSYIGTELEAILSTSNTNLSVGQEYQLTLTLDGNGNTDFFANPLQNLTLDNVFISSPQLNIKIDTDEQNNIFMKKTFTYTLIPQRAGSFTIPNIELKYYTPQGTAKSTSTEALSFSITDTQALVDNPENATILSVPSNRYSFYSGSNYLFIALILAFIIILSSFVQAKHQHKLTTDPSFARQSLAKKRLQDILNKSQKSLHANKVKESAQLLRQSILYYCADRYKLSNDITPQDLVNYFHTNNKNFPSEKGFLDLMKQLEFYSFSGVVQKHQIKEIYNQALSILKDL